MMRRRRGINDRVQTMATAQKRPFLDRLAERERLVEVFGSLADRPLTIEWHRGIGSVYRHGERIGCASSEYPPQSGRDPGEIEVRYRGLEHRLTGHMSVIEHMLRGWLAGVDAALDKVGQP